VDASVVADAVDERSTVAGTDDVAGVAVTGATGTLGPAVVTSDLGELHAVSASATSINRARPPDRWTWCQRRGLAADDLTALTPGSGCATASWQRS